MGMYFSLAGLPECRDMPSLHRTNGQMTVFIRLLPRPAPSFGKRSGDPVKAGPQKFVYRE